MDEDAAESLAGLAMSEPQLFNEMALKRSITYKDPQHTKQPNMQLWNLINQLPEYQVAKVIRPDILRKDKGRPDSHELLKRLAS